MENPSNTKVETHERQQIFTISAEVTNVGDLQPINLPRAAYKGYITQITKPPATGLAPLSHRKLGFIFVLELGSNIT